MNYIDILEKIRNKLQMDEKFYTLHWVWQSIFFFSVVLALFSVLKRPY